MVKSITSGLSNAWFIVVTFVALILVPLLLFGAQFEAKYFPVVQNTSVNSFSTAGETSSYVVGFDRVRQCEMLPDTMKWEITTLSGTKRVAAFGSGDIKVEGRNSFVITSVDNKRHGMISSEKITVNFKCHPMWNTPLTINIK